ncbi:DUF934 domain-containing protein [Moraxella sp. FZLJ2107]|uniref:DUF934 domain-containing protein n=1 Tax=unclassified Moraxella TaxID=2685852 RepID=UPI00209BF2BA|nr:MULTISPECIES: DUF934 domain-containing protein [unclassified Moraxella]USZ15053.1 DUF934 domain-containing protein [Moraxella sp. FZFQ2102]UTO05794.1 DUF934 domain-containing protein [Moraxella sp. FZLJ2107]UTO22530.1 DUF934 domain-containing protein [Moraxella sp. FZLJ2109]
MSITKVYSDARTEAVAISEEELVAALSADTTPDEIESAVQAAPASLLFNLADFKDGRVFSLIRHARHKGFAGEIIVAGDFALDQANYFVKSGATAFLVEEAKLATLTKTLQDLATGYDGETISRLPLFS